MLHSDTRIKPRNKETSVNENDIDNNTSYNIAYHIGIFCSLWFLLFYPPVERPDVVIYDGEFYYLNGRKYIADLKSIDSRLDTTVLLWDNVRPKIPCYNKNGDFRSYLYHDYFHFTKDDPNEYQLICDGLFSFGIFAVDIVVPSIDEIYPEAIVIHDQTNNDNADGPFSVYNIDSKQIVSIVDAVKNETDVRETIKHTLSTDVCGDFCIDAWFKDFPFIVEIYQEEN